jgi:hypothetical protein
VRKSRTPGSVRGYPVTGIPTATFSGGEVMPRNSDIEIAWRQAIVIEPNGRRTVTTSGFIRELAKLTGYGHRARLTSG